jgi:NAD(P)H-quinone oxidoreductase subunit 4L
MIGLESYLIVSSLLFAIGIFICIGKRNLISIVMGIELLLNAVNIAAIAFSRYGSGFSNQSDALAGHVLVIFILTVAAAEAAIALALCVLVYRHFNTINVSDINQLG